MLRTLLLRLCPRAVPRCTRGPLWSGACGASATLPALPTPLSRAPVRWTTYGQEYQPSTLRRKRKFGYLARIRSRHGRKIIRRRILKGRKYLSA